MVKRKNENVIKRFTDHLTIVLEVKFPTRINGGKKKKTPIINLSNNDGWMKYTSISDKHAHRIRKAIETIDDPNVLERKLGYIDSEIQIEAFGIIWVGQSNKSRKAKKKNSKELNDMYKEYLEVESDSFVYSFVHNWSYCLQIKHP